MDILQQKINDLFQVFKFICVYINDLVILTKDYWKDQVAKLEPVCFVFSLENRKPPSHCSNSNYVAGKEIQHGPTEPSNISSREIYRFATCELRADLCSNRQEGFWNR